LKHNGSVRKPSADHSGITAVVLDWAGTVQDHGCMAPMVVFKEVFKEEGVPISTAEARAPMGAHKRVHIQKITRLDKMDLELSVKERWQIVHSKMPTETDIDRMFARFVPLQHKVLANYADLIPGTVETTFIRDRGWKIGSTTGFMK